MTTFDERDAPSRAKTVSLYATAAAMIAIGALHFIAPTPFERIVPPWLPWARGLVFASGVAEIALGAALLVPRARSLAAWGLVALYVAVFPANLHMAMNKVSFVEGQPPPPAAALYARLPLQLALIANAVWLARRNRRVTENKPAR
jgi:uncharacterized membrane protein